jgi:hypothetical protein
LGKTLTREREMKGLIRIDVSPALIERAFKEGVKCAQITEGALPKDAKLVFADRDPKGNIRLWFEGESNCICATDLKDVPPRNIVFKTVEGCVNHA